MTTTLGGCLGANIHGKNNFKMGTIGEHVTEFTAVLPTGAEITCSPNKNGDLFYSMISGLGMLGVITTVTLQMKKIDSGLIEVHAWPTRTLEEQLRQPGRGRAQLRLHRRLAGYHHHRPWPDPRRQLRPRRSRPGQNAG